MSKNAASPRTVSKKLIYGLYIAGVLALVLSGGFWWYRMCNDPQRVFWGMLEQNLATRGMTMQATQEQGNNKIVQTTQFSLGDSNMARSLTQISQPGTTVETEVIGTVTHDYLRYTDIQTEQTGQDGKPLNVSKIENAWVKYDHNLPQDSTLGASKLLAQTVVGTGAPLSVTPVPIGYLQSKDREKLLKQIRSEEIYKPDFKNVTKRSKEGRKQYVYDVKISPILYARLMKTFDEKLGLHELADLDPNSFSGSASVTARLVVDVRSRHLVAIEYDQPGFIQTFSAYDVPLHVDIPKETITPDELQRRFLELQ